MNNYYVYENWQVSPRKTKIHRGSCPFCNNGRGFRGGTDPSRGAWHGPFISKRDAQRKARQLRRTKNDDCQICNP